MRKVFTTVAVTILVLVLAVSAYYAYSQPVKLTIAVGPPEGDDAKIIEAIARRLQSRHEPLQLKVVLEDGSQQASDSVDAGRTDLAVSRGDLVKQPNAGLILTLHRDPVTILATRASGIKKIVDLKGRRVGVIRVNSNADLVSNNAELLKSVLSYYSITPAMLSIVPLTIADLPQAVADKRIEALFVVAPSGEALAMKAVEVMGMNQAAGPVFVPISEPDALVLANPRLVKDEIVRGTYGGDPAKPSVAVPTISVSHNIVASNSLSDSRVANLTRSIFGLKNILSRDIKLAARMEAPSTNKDAATPIHPGAAAYIDDEEKSFFDRFGDLFYIGTMLIGVLASAIAALFGRRSSAARNDALKHIEAGVELLHAARQAASPEAIVAVELAADGCVAEVARAALSAHLNVTDIAAFNMTVQQIRDTLTTRRLAISGQSDDAPGGDIQDLQSRATNAGKSFPSLGVA